MNLKGSATVFLIASVLILTGWLKNNEAAFVFGLGMDMAATYIEFINRPRIEDDEEEEEETTWDY